MHTVSGLIRKPPYIKTGCGQDGQSTMYIVELSEMVKDYKTSVKTYSNYSAMLFAKSPGAIEFYNSALAEGSFVVISAEKIKVEQRENQGKNYVTLHMDNPRLENANYSSNAAPAQQAPQQSGFNQPPPQQRAQSQGDYRNGSQSGYQDQVPPQDFQQAQSGFAQQQAQPKINPQEPQGEWDDSIPFAPVGLQYNNHFIHAI